MDFIHILSILKPYFVLFFLYHQFSSAINETLYNPNENILLNCGSSNGGAAIDGRQWSGDYDNISSLIEPSSGNTSVNANASMRGNALAAPYVVARISRSPFTYTFPVTAGQKFIRLHFYPTQYGLFSKCNDFSTVKVGIYTLLNNFSASLYADNWNTQTFFIEFCVNVEHDEHQLNISFAPFLGGSDDAYVFINGIEIVSMPTNLYYTPFDGVGPMIVGQNNKSTHVRNHTALQNMCRLQIGGLHISSIEDTGMYREWNGDSPYFVTLSKSWRPREPNANLNHSKVPAYTAPDDVYRSGRSLGPNTTYNLLNNLTWVVAVDHGFKYLVRLHFCEFVQEVTKVGQRRFGISVANQTVETGLDIFESSGGRDIPIYKDYIVNIGNKGATNDYYMYISLFPDPTSYYKDAILSGIEVFKLSDNTRSLAGPNLPQESPQMPAPVQQPMVRKSRNRKKLIIAVSASVLGFLLLGLSLFCLIILQQKRRKHLCSFHESLAYCLRKGKSSSVAENSLLPDKRCRNFSLNEIKASTNNFDEKLVIGVGGFGNVYRGDIDNVKNAVAIKRLNPLSKQGAREFITEIEMLSQLRHAHLVSLIGYCNENNEMILVYEYMSNGTLREHLDDTDNPLPWNKRLEICVGAASGLNYLHTGMEHTIIHRDVKTSNILLDEKWVAKVSDFGLSKTNLNDTAVSTLVKGTWGYLDPEYVKSKLLTEKSDVYSFGVVLFEVLCARKPIIQRLEEEQRNLARWVCKCIHNGTIHHIIDPNLMGKIAPECFSKFLEIAEKCLRDLGTERPTMADVTESLQFALELQVAAELEIEKMDPGGENRFPEISFYPTQIHGIIDGGRALHSSGVSDSNTLDTNLGGLPTISLDSVYGGANSSSTFSKSKNSTV